MLHVGNPGALSGISLGDQDYFKQLFELSPDPAWIIDGNRFIECNEAAIKALGYPNRFELLNLHPSKLSPPRQPDGEDSFTKAERMMAIAKDKGLHRFEWVHTKANGTDFVAEVTLSAIQLLERPVIYCVWRDIHERKKTEDALRESEESYRALVEWSPVAIAVHQAGKLAYVNPAAVNMVGAKSAQDLVGKPMLDWVHPDFRQLVLTRVKISFELGITQPAVEEKILKVDGSAIDVVVKSTPILYNGTAAVQVVIRDITESKQMEKQVRELAFFDPLTQLPNRRLLDDRLCQTLADSKRSGRYGALMFLDLDNFKALNDSQGHAVGDLLLVQAGQRMKSCVRETDTVARHGGDEFVVMVGDLTGNKVESSAQARSIAEKIRSALAKPYALTVKHEGQAEATVEYQCTASIGVVVFIAGQGSQEDFLRWADSAMYQAKDAGSNLIRFYEAQGQA